GVREPVAAPDDERLKRVLRVQPGRGGPGRGVLLVPGLSRLLALSLRLVVVEVHLVGRAEWGLLRSQRVLGCQRMLSRMGMLGCHGMLLLRRQLLVSGRRAVGLVRVPRLL